MHNDTLRESIPHVFHDNPRKPSLVSVVSKAQSRLLQAFGLDTDVCYTLTEKTDGMVAQIGMHSERGLWIKTAHEGPFTTITDLKIAASYKLDPKIAAQYDGYSQFFEELRKCGDLIAYLTSIGRSRGWENAWVKGELLWRNFGQIDGDLINFVGTRYDLKHFGTRGMFVVHTQLCPDKHVVDYPVRAWSTNQLTFNDDLVYLSPAKVQVSDLRGELFHLPPVLRRDDVNWLVIMEVAREFKKRLERAFHIDRELPFKWGPETEGWVLHGPLRLKIVHPDWEVRKAERTNFK